MPHHDRRTFLRGLAAVSSLGAAFSAGALPHFCQAAAAGPAELPAPPPAPAWAKNARILSAQYDDILDLPRARQEFEASVLVLYCCPETSNGWCPIGSWEQVAYFIARAHQNDLKVICYCDTTQTEEAFLTPERKTWVQTAKDGALCMLSRPHVWQRRYAFCYNTPWSARVAEIARHYAALGADGVFLDNPNYYDASGPTCFCEYCRAAYQRETGEDLAQAAEAPRIAWHQKSLREHVKRVYQAAQQAASGRELVITCNTSSPRRPMQRLEHLGQAENVIFRETAPGHKHAEAGLRNDAAVWPDKPLWVILTEVKDVWAHDVALAARQYDELLSKTLAVGACPMVWATVTSQNPRHPGFTQVSIYNQPELAKVVAKHFRRKAAGA